MRGGSGSRDRSRSCCQSPRGSGRCARSRSSNCGLRPRSGGRGARSNPGCGPRISCGRWNWPRSGPRGCRSRRSRKSADGGPGWRCIRASERTSSRPGLMPDERSPCTGLRGRSCCADGPGPAWRRGPSATWSRDGGPERSSFPLCGLGWPNARGASVIATAAARIANFVIWTPVLDIFSVRPAVRRFTPKCEIKESHPASAGWLMFDKGVSRQSAIKRGVDAG